LLFCSSSANNWFAIRSSASLEGWLHLDLRWMTLLSSFRFLAAFSAFFASRIYWLCFWRRRPPCLPRPAHRIVGGLRFCKLLLCSFPFPLFAICLILVLTLTDWAPSGFGPLKMRPLMASAASAAFFAFSSFSFFFSFLVFFFFFSVSFFSSRGASPPGLGRSPARRVPPSPSGSSASLSSFPCTPVHVAPLVSTSIHFGPSSLVSSCIYTFCRPNGECLLKNFQITI